MIEEGIIHFGQRRSIWAARLDDGKQRIVVFGGQMFMFNCFLVAVVTIFPSVEP